MELTAEIKGKILVVDDEPSALRIIDLILSSLGHDVILADNGESAIKIALKDIPDLILIDALMPGIDGFETARMLKNNPLTALIPIVIITGMGDVTYRIKAVEAGADDFFTKPVDVIELRARIDSQIKVKRYNDHMKSYQLTLEAEVEKRTRQLTLAFEQIKKSSLDTILRLIKASEYRDEDTGVHIIRMSNYSAIISEKMGLPAKAIESILYASPMHDIGKIGIPDKILLKAGKLNEYEWGIMKQHTVFGAKILDGADSSILQMACTIALNHHERWDGKGYPNGLKGTKIPLAAQIVSIADVFDALTSRRPYKQPYTVEKSIDIIKEMSGSAFDPEIVEAFLSSMDKIMAVKNAHTDDEDSILSILNESLLAAESGEKNKD